MWEWNWIAVHGFLQPGHARAQGFRHYETIVAIMDKVAIFGAAGPIGRYVGMELDRRGVPFRAVGRTASKLAEAFGKLPHAEGVAADLSDAGGAIQAARGVDTIVYAVGVAYTEFQLHPKMMRVAVDAAAAAGVQRLVLVTGIYSYGVPQTKKVAETHPRVPVSVKGQLRKEQEDILMAAGERGLFKSMVVRLPDFYGPYTHSLASFIFDAALAGKTANWLGPISSLHEFVFVPDAGPVIAELASREDCYGKAWNFAGPGEISALAFIQKIYQAAGREPKFRSGCGAGNCGTGFARGLLRKSLEFRGTGRDLGAGFHPEDLPGGGTRAEIPQRRPHAAPHAWLVQSIDARDAGDVISAGNARAAGRREAARQAGAGAQDEL